MLLVGVHVNVNVEVSLWIGKRCGPHTYGDGIVLACQYVREFLRLGKACSGCVPYGGGRAGGHGEGLGRRSNLLESEHSNG